MNWIVFVIAAALLLGLSNRVFGGSTRMTLVAVVAISLVGLYVTELR